MSIEEMRPMAKTQLHVVAGGGRARSVEKAGGKVALVDELDAIQTVEVSGAAADTFILHHYFYIIIYCY